MKFKVILKYFINKISIVSLITICGLNCYCQKSAMSVKFSLSSLMWCCCVFVYKLSVSLMLSQSFTQMRIEKIENIVEIVNATFLTLRSTLIALELLCKSRKVIKCWSLHLKFSKFHRESSNVDIYFCFCIIKSTYILIDTFFNGVPLIKFWAAFIYISSLLSDAIINLILIFIFRKMIRNIKICLSTSIKASFYQIKGSKIKGSNKILSLLNAAKIVTLVSYSYYY